MEIDLSLFADRFVMLAIVGGFLGGLAFYLIEGALSALGERLHARSRRLERIAQARIRAQSIFRAMPRG